MTYVMTSSPSYHKRHAVVVSGPLETCCCSSFLGSSPAPRTLRRSLLCGIPYNPTTRACIHRNMLRRAQDTPPRRFFKLTANRKNMRLNPMACIVESNGHRLLNVIHLRCHLRIRRVAPHQYHHREHINAVSIE